MRKEHEKCLETVIHLIAQIEPTLVHITKANRIACLAGKQDMTGRWQQKLSFSLRNQTPNTVPRLS